VSAVSLPGDLNALIYLRKTLVLVCSNTPRLNFFLGMIFLPAQQHVAL
jgi:hypothetical protein